MDVEIIFFWYYFIFGVKGYDYRVFYRWFVFVIIVNVIFDVYILIIIMKGRKKMNIVEYMGVLSG